METPVQPAPKKMNTGLIIGIVVVVVLCCCCVIAGVVGYYYVSKQVKNTYSSINEALQTPIAPAIPLPTNEAGTPEIPAVPANVMPQGGLGDEVQRGTAWGYVITSAALSNCITTDPTKTTIDVLEQPNSAGVWKEKWTVTCDSGSTKAFDVTFTPNKQGGTDINVTSSK